MFVLVGQQLRIWAVIRFVQWLQILGAKGGRIRQGVGTLSVGAGLV